MNPDNASKGAGAFKEGVIRIDANSYVVDKGAEGQADSVPATKWKWKVTRMAEGGQEPLTDEHDNPITEDLYFSFGGKCLPFVHPGNAQSAEDDEPEDLGTAVGTEGNTIYLNASDWRPNEKSGLMTLTRSLTAQSIKTDYLNRCWAPDWNGCVFDMRTQVSGDSKDGRSFNYKVVAKVLVGPGKSKGGKSSANGKPDEAGVELAKILNLLSQELDGQAITRKAFLNRVRGSMDVLKIDAKLLVPVLSLAKDDKWLGAHAETLDYSLDPANNTIIFGTIEATA
jgi:hypothetical protein